VGQYLASHQTGVLGHDDGVFLAVDCESICENIIGVFESLQNYLQLSGRNLLIDQDNARRVRHGRRTSKVTEAAHRFFPSLLKIPAKSTLPVFTSLKETQKKKSVRFGTAYEVSIYAVNC
jgi:hypothetical protein